MEKVPSGSPIMMLTILALLFCMICLPIYNDEEIFSSYSSENTTFQIHPITQVNQHDYLSERPHDQASHSKLMWEPWIGILAAVLAWNISVLNHGQKHYTGNIPTYRDFLLLFMHDRDGKKRSST